MRRRHFRGAKMMRILESAIITLSSSSGRGGQKSCTHFGGEEHSPPFFEKGKQFCFRRFANQGGGRGKKTTNGDFWTFKGWRLSTSRKKRLEEEQRYYYVTRGQERDSASTHTTTTTTRRRKYLSFPRKKHARKKSL